MWECNVRRICEHIIFDMDEFTCFGWPTTNDDFKLQLTIFPPFWEGGWFLNQENSKKLSTICYSPFLLLESKISSIPDPGSAHQVLCKNVLQGFFHLLQLVVLQAPLEVSTKIRPKKTPGHPGKTSKICCLLTVTIFLKQNAVGSSPFQLVRHEISSKVTRKSGKASWALKMGTENADIGMPSSHVKHCHVRNLGKPSNCNDSAHNVVYIISYHIIHLTWTVCASIKIHVVLICVNHIYTLLCCFLFYTKKPPTYILVQLMSTDTKSTWQGNMQHISRTTWSSMIVLWIMINI